MNRRPNIILCTCDQLRAFELGCYGNGVLRTPHVDRLAAEGVRFETAVSNYPVCMAARSVLISGQYNRTCTGGVSNVSFPGRPGDHPLPEYPFAGRPHLKDPTLAECLRAAGYRTSAIGKWHIHSWPHDIGFDHYIIPRVHHCHTGQSFTEDGGPEFVPPGYSVDFEIERVERLLQAHKPGDTPFFLYYNISLPHCPLADAPEAFRTMYRPEDVRLRPNVNPDQPLKNQEYFFKVYRHDFRYYSFHLPHTEQLPEGYSLRDVIAEYYGLTAWMDTTVGRLLRALDRTGLADDTIVVFTADHGDNLGSHGLVQKGGPNEESIRIPMLIRWPRLPPSRVVDSHVFSLVDVAPTLFGLLGMASPAHWAGRNLAPLCRGEACHAGTDAFVEVRNGVAIRTPDAMCYAPLTGPNKTPADAPAQLFDMTRDPYQLHELAASERHTARTQKLMGRLQEWNAAIPWMEAG